MSVQVMNWGRSAARVVRAVQDALVPQTCAGCGEWIPGDEGVLCRTCRERMARSEAVTYCPRCGRTMPRSAIHAESCAACRREPFWNAAGLVRLGAYAPPFNRLVSRLKYKGDQRGVLLLAERLAAAIERRGWHEGLDYIIPVPITLLRRWQRRCDQSAVLAAAVARQLGRPLLRAVRRIRHSPSQTRVVSRTERFENVRGCFAARRGAARRLAGRCVCIVDNVLVSGATMHEMAKVVRRAGARRIYGVTVCRSLMAGEIQVAPSEEADVGGAES